MLKAELKSGENEVFRDSSAVEQLAVNQWVVGSNPTRGDKIKHKYKNMNIPAQEEFISGCREFEKHEKRDAMYKVATFLVSHFWGNPSKMADGLGVLLLTWNQAFYRFGVFDFDKLEECIKINLKMIEGFRNRDISSLSKKDENNINILFNEFLDALQIDIGKKRGTKSPVSVAKALHLLAPQFFPLWDDKIARAYNCYYNKNPVEKYILFSQITKGIADEVKDYVSNSDKSLIKLIDEYNYSKYTKNWI